MPSSGKRLSLTKKEAKDKLAHYCAYQERCHMEVREKLRSLGVYDDMADEVLSELITENFISEERFARTFAGGKFRLKKWGRVKIKNNLKQKHISTYCINKAMEEISEEDYISTLESLITSKSNTYNEIDPFVKRSKVANYLLGKGFEGTVIWPTIMRLIPDK